MNVFITIFVLLLSTPAWATIYYVSKTASNGYAVGSNSNSCAQAQDKATPKNTIDGSSTSVMDACVVGGDTVIVNEGTYTNQITNPPAGTAEAYTIIMADPSSARPLLRPDGTATQRGFYCDNGAACSYIRMEGFDVGEAYNSVKLTSTNVVTLGYPHHMQFVNNIFHDTRSTNFETTTSTGTGGEGGDHLIQGNEFYHTGIYYPSDHGGKLYGPGHNTIYNPGNRTIIERNTFHNNHGAVGIWHSGKYIYDVIVRYNACYDLGLTLTTDTWQEGTTATGYSCIHVSAGGGRHKIYGNVIWNSGEDVNFKAISINPLFGQSTFERVDVYNNTVYNMKHSGAIGIRVSSNVDFAGRVVATNNLVIPVLGTAIDDQSGVSALTQVTNRTTGTATDLWASPGTGDLTLKAGSAAINTGTSIGDAYCGSAPDQGAFETLVVTAASIMGNLLDVTVCNAHPPIIPGTFTVARSGGTPTVLSTSLLGGSGGIVRLEVSETCAAAQTWTVSGGTSTTDSALIGNTRNQPLHTTTAFAVDSSACDGTAAGGAPAGAVAIYAFDGDTNDSSGNGNHATSSNVTFTDGHNGDGALTAVGVDSHIATGLLSGHDPSTTHLVVSTWVYIDPANLGQTKDIWGAPVTGSDRFFLYRSSANVWRMGIGATSGAATEFPVVSGWTHACVKMHPTGDIATMYINGVAGTIEGASLISGYGSYTFSGALRFGLPSGFSTSLSGAHIYDDAYIYTTDVSCTDLYNAGQPSTGSAMSVQATHHWQGVFTASGGVAEDRGAADAQRTAVKGGAAALMVQLNNTSGASVILQPRFRYNINGGDFTNVVPNSPTADGVSYWGSSIPTGLNNGLADGPISGALAHTDGITLTTSLAVPTVTMSNNTSYTLRGVFLIDAAVSDVVCFKVYDQGGSALASYTPSDGACLTVIAPQATGGY